MVEMHLAKNLKSTSIGFLFPLNILDKSSFSENVGRCTIGGTNASMAGVASGMRRTPKNLVLNEQQNLVLNEQENLVLNEQYSLK